MRLSGHVFSVWLMVFAALPAMAQDRPRVVAVNYPLQYFAERLLGDAAEVVFPVPPDEDPSFWRPSVSDIGAIQSADLIVLNGAGFAAWVDRVSLPRSKVVNTSGAIEDRFIRAESITHSHGDGGEHSHEGLASYIWLDPTLAIAQAEAVADALTARQLAPAKDVETRLGTLRADLEALDTIARTTMGRLKGVGIIATHPRYQYFARSYGLSIASLEWEAGAMPTDSDLAELRALTEDTEAQILIWEAQPAAGAFDATAALGLRNVVFPPLAQAIEGRTFQQTFAAGLSAMADATDQ